jgi:release factor glutamine methyltransferase
VARSGAGLLAIEVGAGQAVAVGELMRDAGFAQVDARRDLAGIERAVVGRR